MPTNRSIAEFTRRIDDIGRAAQRSQRDAVNRASLILKRSIETELTGAVGGDHRMSNLRRNTASQPARLSVGFDVKGSLNPTSLMRARGPWGLVEYGSPPHVIYSRTTSVGTRGTRRARRQRDLNLAFGGRGAFAGARPMPINGDFRYAVQRHPGTRGKRPFHRGVDKATRRAITELHTVVRGAVADVFRSGRDTYINVRGEVGSTP